MLKICRRKYLNNNSPIIRFVNAINLLGQNYYIDLFLNTELLIAFNHGKTSSDLQYTLTLYTLITERKYCRTKIAF